MDRNRADFLACMCVCACLAIWMHSAFTSKHIIWTLSDTTENYIKNWIWNGTVWILPYRTTYSPNNLSLFELTWASCWAAASRHQPVSVSAADVSSVWGDNKKRWLWVSTHTPRPRHAVTCVSTEDFHCKAQASQTREQAIRVCPCESPLTTNASGEIFTGIRQAPDRKNESMLCSTSSIAWKFGSYGIVITQNYIAEVWNKAYSEDCAQDEGWEPAVQANWTGSICCAGFAAELQSAPVGCRTAIGRSHMGSSTPLPSRISAHSVWWHWKSRHCIYKW